MDPYCFVLKSYNANPRVGDTRGWHYPSFSGAIRAHDPFQHTWHIRLADVIPTLEGAVSW